ncbi:hypothetical protein COOONC_12794 [Cooperia oncophora]
MMRKSDALGLDRPKVNGGSVLPKNMSFPDSIRLDPIRLPRPTILRDDPPLTDISSRQQDVSTYPIGHFRTPYGAYAATYSPQSFPEHIRSRHLSPVNALDTSNQPAPVNVTYSGRLVTDRVPLTEVWQPIQPDPYFSDPPIRTTPPIPRITTSPQQANSPVPAVTGTTATVTDAVQSSYQSADRATIRARALSRNSFLGYQRFIFLMARYPALVMAMVALWNVTGRGKGMAKTSTEEIAFYAALATAGVVLISQMLLHSNHHGSYKKARAMSFLYHFAMLVAFCTAVVSVVFAAINLNNFTSEKTPATTCKYKPCYSNRERLTYLATLVGCGGVIVLLALATFLYGTIGINVLKKRLAEEYRKEASQRSYENNAFQY